MRPTQWRLSTHVVIGVAVLLVAGVPMLAGSRVSFWHFAAFFGAARAGLDSDGLATWKSSSPSPESVWPNPEP